ncbi:hypothetical protein BLNAU_1582 [Blattamonas nauphoetae]|uniref:Uncharacterized protein n=1 Tax=Blattamonas nauphoetae TaxID=2049346 RepID=A0ABQ9YIF7_9EUKA|nr:hypothetical protein BLNAU_1582 [Blattamonas nauphoetae]
MFELFLTSVGPQTLFPESLFIPGSSASEESETANQHNGSACMLKERDETAWKHECPRHTQPTLRLPRRDLNLPHSSADTSTNDSKAWKVIVAQSMAVLDPPSVPNHTLPLPSASPSPPTPSHFPRRLLLPSHLDDLSTPYLLDLSVIDNRNVVSPILKFILHVIQLSSNNHVRKLSRPNQSQSSFLVVA